MTAHVETHELEPGLTEVQISASSHNDVLLEIEQITGRAGDHEALFQPIHRCRDINDPVKRWRSHGVLRAVCEDLQNYLNRKHEAARVAPWPRS